MPKKSKPKPMTCSTPGCNGQVLAKGMCSACYYKARRKKKNKPARPEERRRRVSKGEPTPSKALKFSADATAARFASLPADLIGRLADAKKGLDAAQADYDQVVAEVLEVVNRGA